MFSVALKQLMAIAAFIAMNGVSCDLWAQNGPGTRGKTAPDRPRNAKGAPAESLGRTATIHWQRVPLRDALARLRSLFDDAVFVDRRIDPNMRVSLDIEGGSAEDVVAALAAGQNLGADRLGSVVYLGPSSAADQLRAISAARSQDVGRLPADLRASLTQKQPTDWPRLSEPRGVIASIVEHRGWRVANADAIPHDLWPAGKLPTLAFAEQLTVLLIGFDLSFELRPDDRSIEIVSLKGTSKPADVRAATQPTATRPSSTRGKQDSRHVYTLRVQEKPVRAVLQELSKRLHWAIQIDEESIRRAGKSLDARVSFSVENVNQQQLLTALLRPAGLDFRLNGERVRIIAGHYVAK